MSSSFSLGLCQFNSIVGDIENNTKRIIEYIGKAEQKGVDLLVFPELSLSGYSPMDLLYYDSFGVQIDRMIEEIIASIQTDLKVILGTPRKANDPVEKQFLRYFNSALIISKEGIEKEVHKTLLPNYDIFQEKRHFLPSVQSNNTDAGIYEFHGYKLGIQICEDMWSHLPVYDGPEFEVLEKRVTRNLVKKGAELIINISASPFVKEKAGSRLQIVKSHSQNFGVPFVYVNAVGGMDEIVFDGRSIICNSDGELVFAGRPFEEELYILQSDTLTSVSATEHIVKEEYEFSPEMEMIEAISLNLRDYLYKINYHGKLLVALSGGIDSALTAWLCSYAVGPDRVIGVSLPSKYSSDHSIADAKLLAKNLGLEYYNIPIQKIHAIFSDVIGEKIEIKNGLADENIQSRIRGDIMMYLSNLWGHILISTGNKSEIAVGYCTLYGDTAGGKNLIGDMYKTEVYRIARYINQQFPDMKIPVNSIEKPPSAELRDDQRDSDSLPEYDILDSILEMMIDFHHTSTEIIGMGFDPNTVNKISSLVAKSEFKRRQMVQTVKLTENAFGVGRIVPVSTPYKP